MTAIAGLGAGASRCWVGGKLVVGGSKVTPRVINELGGSKVTPRVIDELASSASVSPDVSTMPADLALVTEIGAPPTSSSRACCPARSCLWSWRHDQDRLGADRRWPRVARRAAACGAGGVTTIAVFGAGAIGCWVGGKLAAGGAKVTLIGWPRVIDELDATSTTTADLVLVTVKSAQTADAELAVAGGAGGMTKIAVFGAGAIGCWVGGKLAAGPAKVTLIGLPRVIDEVAGASVSPDTMTADLALIVKSTQTADAELARVLPGAQSLVELAA